MISNKQRAHLRGVANKIEPSFQIGKEGLKENSISAIDEQLTARELVKIKVLPSCELSPKEAAEELAKALCAESVQVIGAKIVLYRFSKNEKIKHIELPL